MTASDDIIGSCSQCGHGLTRADYGRETLCLSCGQPTRTCLNCRFHARGRPNDCAEPMAEPVPDKRRANFCEFFDPKPAQPGATPASERADDELRLAAEALFKR